jgi:DNA replication and repair protein RecF
MHLEKLYLQNVRQFSHLTLDFPQSLTLILAPNGAGKTTIIEAIRLLSTAKSFRAKKTAELIKFNQPFAHAYGLLNDQLRLGVTLTSGQIENKKTAVRTYSLNKTKKRQKDFIGNLLTACFRPEDLRLIEGSANRRRDYVDDPLILTSKIYQTAHQNYHAALIRRHQTLVAIKDGQLDLSALLYWNNILLETSTIIHRLRQQYFDFANLQTQVLPHFKIIYHQSLITPERLKQYQNAEIASTHNLIGPHKDDFTIEFNFSGTTASLMTYGSRGQHRLAVLWLKMIELTYLTQNTTQTPILLLDDICSELDEQSKSLVATLATQQQTIITTTERNVLELFKTKTQVITLS